MGKTYKDQRKYDKKQRDREDTGLSKTPKRNRHARYDEVIPDDDEMDKYEYLDYDYDDDDRR